MRLVQFLDKGDKQRVGIVAQSGVELEVVDGTDSVFELALQAARRSESLGKCVGASRSGTKINYDELIASHRLLPPLTHPDPYRCLVTGTGLSHLGSAAARDAMHVKIQKADS